MMFGCEFGPNAEKYTTRMSASLPNGSTLQFTTVSARPFTVAFSLKREGSIVNAVVVVHSRDYPSKFDRVIKSVIDQFHNFVGGKADALHVVICLERKLYVALALEPKCLSCFDVEGYISPQGRPFAAVCTVCNRDAKLSVNPDGSCTIIINEKFCQHDGVKLLTERKLNDFKPCGKVCYTCFSEASKNCICGGVRYCSEDCQKKDWGRHKNGEHKEFLAHKTQDLLASQLLRNGYSISSLL